jgi:ketosteroid isomerase-like protein
MNVTKVLAGGGDIAVLYNDWRMTAAGADGRRERSSGKAIEIVRRQADGSWKFVIDDPHGRS